MSYRADYAGDANYPARSGACEPLQVQQQQVCPQCPPPPCPAYPVFPGQPGNVGGPCALSVLSTQIIGNIVEITIQDNGSGDALLTGVSLNWPAASNGALKAITLNGYVYSGPDLTSGSMQLTFADLNAINPITRTIKVGQSQKLRFVFGSRAEANKALYAATAQFGAGCVVNLLP
jgi:hypothetical protein